MPRINFDDGVEIIHEDLSNIPAALELELYDRVIYELMQRQKNCVFGAGLKVTYVNATTLQVAAGVGFQYDNTQVDPESMNRLLFVAINTNKTITAADGSHGRIDILSIKANRAATADDTRNVKSAIDSTVAGTLVDTETDWASDLLITAGTPSVSPAVPATPVGYIKLAEIVVTQTTGISGSSAITDKRPKFFFGGQKTVSVSATYTATVDDRVILANGTFTITLPSSADRYDATNDIAMPLTVINVGTGVITLDGAGSETMSGDLTETLDNQYTTMHLVPNGANWFIT